MAKKVKEKTEEVQKVITHFTWADECDFEGLEIWDKEALKEAKAKIKALFDKKSSFNISFGTNEVEDFDSYDNVVENIKKEKKITAEEAETLEKLLGDKKFGITLSSVIAQMDEEFADSGADDEDEDADEEDDEDEDCDDDCDCDDDDDDDDDDGIGEEEE